MNLEIITMAQIDTQIYKHDDSYAIMFFINQVYQNTIYIKNHSEQYAEDAAENFVLGVEWLTAREEVDRFEQVLNYPNSLGVGRFDPKDPNVATGMTGAPACGDVMKLQLN